MNEKQLLEMAEIDAADWERTPASVKRLVVQLGVKLELFQTTQFAQDL